MKKIILLISSILFLTSTLIAKEVKIGVILPMTGAIAAFGQTSYEGIKLANKLEPKLKNGDTISLVLVDNKADKIETATAATRLISSDKVSGIVGALTSNNVGQVVAIAEKKKIPVVAPVATAEKLTLNRTYANRVCFMNSFQGSVVANYAYKDLGLKSAVVIVDQAQTYPLGLARAFKKSFTKLNGKILKEIKITTGDKDFKAVVSQIKSLNPDFIFLPLYHSEASMIAIQAKQIGLQKPIISGDGVANPTFIELGGEAVEGYMFTDFFDYSAPPTQKSKDFLVAYEKESGKKELNSFAALTADSYFVMVGAMNRCEDPTDSVCVNNEIKKTEKFEGVSGIITIDKNGNAERSAVIKVIKDGVAVYKATVNP